MSTPPLVWLITGTSSGLGRELALAVLERGDKVIATARARSMHKLQDLQDAGADTLELEVTSPLETLKEVAKKAVAIHGRIDVVVNNAGYCQAGTVEEVSPEEAYDQYNTHVLGAMNVSRAFLPFMRERRTGTVVFIGSVYGYISQGVTGIYASTKWALRGKLSISWDQIKGFLNRKLTGLDHSVALALAMHDEISPLGLRATCIDFGFFRTPILEPTQRAPEVYRIDDYKEVVDNLEGMFKKAHKNQPGDPRKGVHVIVDMVRGEGLAAGKTFPTGLCLGPDCYQMAKDSLEKTLARMEEWKDATCSTNYD